MKIYFSGSISGGRNRQPLYKQIVDYLVRLGAEVLTEHVANPNVLQSESRLTPEAIYQRDMQLLERCDGLIAEVSNPSLGVGYEIAVALSWEKTTLCLCEKNIFLSRILSGNHDPNLTIVYYTYDQEWQNAVKRFFLKINERTQDRSIRKKFS